jgi:hypothetical protein
VPGQHVLVPARRLRDRLRPAVPGRHARDHHRYQRRQRMPLSPAASADRSGDPPATPAWTRDPVPVAAGRRRRMQPASHDEDTGVVLSVLSGLPPESSPRLRPHFKHIRTTGPYVARCPASRVTSPRSNQRKGPGSLDSCEAPTLLVTHRHTDFDESPSAHRHFENKSASIEVRYGLM